MEFDVFGISAKSKKGEHFRNSVWWWRPLTKYVLDNVDIPDDDDSFEWQSNDGYEVSEESALKIAETLERLVKEGHTARYAQEYKQWQEGLPLVDCWICDGTGQCDDLDVQGACFVCGGLGKKNDWNTRYSFSVENVQEFGAFCRDSGGFRIC